MNHVGITLIITLHRVCLADTLTTRLVNLVIIHSFHTGIL